MHNQINDDVRQINIYYTQFSIRFLQHNWHILLSIHNKLAPVLYHLRSV